MPAAKGREYKLRTPTAPAGALEAQKIKKLDRMKRLINDLDRIRLERSEAVKRYNEQIDALQTEIIALARQDDSQYELPLDA